MTSKAPTPKAGRKAARSAGNARPEAPASAQQRADEAFEKAYEPNFIPVAPRARRDGWTPARQAAFIEALAQSGCVKHAAASVGMSVAGAYRLRQHGTAITFRAAWDIAIEQSMDRLADEALSRALNGVARPVFHKGEIVGERRYFDERLTQFLLRTRRPGRYGRWIDSQPHEDPSEQAPLLLASLASHLASGQGDLEAILQQLGREKKST